MKLSFSTKGWHDQSWEDFFLIAAEQGFSGIELHDVRRFSASVSAPFSPQNAAATNSASPNGPCFRRRGRRKP